MPGPNRRFRRCCRLLFWLLPVLPAVPAVAATLEVGPDKPMKQPSEAAAAAADGDHILIAPGEYFDCAVWRANKLVIEGTGKPEDTVITDKTCNGKGLFLTDGEDITIRNLTLTRARVPDGNGAGIRMEAGNLTVEHVRFVNNQNGILTNADVKGCAGRPRQRVPPATAPATRPARTASTPTTSTCCMSSGRSSSRPARRTTSSRGPAVPR